MPYRCSVFSHVSNDISSRRCGSRSWPILVNRSDFNGANSVPLERVWSFKYPLACSSSSCSHAYSTFGLSLGGPDETASADWVLCGPIVWLSLYTMVNRSPCPELVPSGLLFSIWVMPSGMNENLFLIDLSAHYMLLLPMNRIRVMNVSQKDVNFRLATFFGHCRPTRYNWAAIACFWLPTQGPNLVSCVNTMLNATLTWVWIGMGHCFRDLHEFINQSSVLYGIRYIVYYIQLRCISSKPSL